MAVSGLLGCFVELLGGGEVGSGLRMDVPCGLWLDPASNCISSSAGPPGVSRIGLSFHHTMVG